MNEKHLTEADARALAEGTVELTAEMAEHLDRCPLCAELLDRHARTGAFISFDVAADDAAIDRIAAYSFDYIDAEKQGFFAALFTLPRLAFGAAAALLFLVAAYFGSGALTGDDETKFAGDDPIPRTAPTLDATPRDFTDGVAINHGRAALTVKGGATLSADGAEILRLAKGTVAVAIEKGNDFRIHTADRYLVRVLGTRFLLDTDGIRLTVTVTEGLVEVIDEKTSDAIALSGGMSHLFTDEVKNIAGASPAKKGRVETAPKTPAEDTISPLQRGRTALKEGDTAAAMDLFAQELADGAEKDKALFEIVRILEKEGRFREVLGLFRKHDAIVDGDSPFREEFLIKSCKAEAKTGIGTLPSCRKYLQEFPDGYKKEDIRDLLEGGDAR